MLLCNYYSLTKLDTDVRRRERQPNCSLRCQLKPKEWSPNSPLEQLHFVCYA